MLQGRAATLYCFRNHNIHMSSRTGVSKIILDDCRDESWFQGNEGLGFVDRSTECKASSWGVLYASQNNAEYLLSLTFPPLLEIPKIQDQLFRKWTVCKKREELFFHRRGDTLNFVYSLDNTRMNHLKVDRIRGLCSCTFVASEKEKNEMSPRLLQSYIELHYWVSASVRGGGGGGEI